MKSHTTRHVDIRGKSNQCYVWNHTYNSLPNTTFIQTIACQHIAPRGMIEI